MEHKNFRDATEVIEIKVTPWDELTTRSSDHSYLAASQEVARTNQQYLTLHDRGLLIGDDPAVDATTDFLQQQQKGAFGKLTSDEVRSEYDAAWTEYASTRQEYEEMLKEAEGPSQDILRQREDILEIVPELRGTFAKLPIPESDLELATEIRQAIDNLDAAHPELFAPWAIPHADLMIEDDMIVGEHGIRRPKENVRLQATLDMIKLLQSKDGRALTIAEIGSELYEDTSRPSYITPEAWPDGISKRVGALISHLRHDHVPQEVQAYMEQNGLEFTEEEIEKDGRRQKVYCVVKTQPATTEAEAQHIEPEPQSIAPETAAAEQETADKGAIETTKDAAEKKRSLFEEALADTQKYFPAMVQQNMDPQKTFNPRLLSDIFPGRVFGTRTSYQRLQKSGGLVD